MSSTETIEQLRRDAETLRQRADVLESQICTGVAATWCPLHGDCKCPRPLGDGLDDLNDRDCPLHSAASSHAEAEVEVGR